MFPLSALSDFVSPSAIGRQVMGFSEHTQASSPNDLIAQVDGRKCSSVDVYTTSSHIRAKDTDVKAQSSCRRKIAAKVPRFW